MGRPRKYNFISPKHPEAETNAHTEYHRLHRTGLDHEAIKKKMGPDNYQDVLKYNSRRKHFAELRKKAAKQAKAALPSDAAAQGEWNPNSEMASILAEASRAGSSSQRPPDPATPLLSDLLDPGAIARAARRRRTNLLRKKKTNRGRNRGGR